MLEGCINLLYSRFFLPTEQPWREADGLEQGLSIDHNKITCDPVYTELCGGVQLLHKYFPESIYNLFLPYGSKQLKKVLLSSGGSRVLGKEVGLTKFLDRITGEVHEVVVFHNWTHTIFQHFFSKPPPPSPMDPPLLGWGCSLLF